jgi:hypothetical protein
LPLAGELAALSAAKTLRRYRHLSALLHDVKLKQMPAVRELTGRRRVETDFLAMKA